MRPLSLLLSVITLTAVALVLPCAAAAAPPQVAGATVISSSSVTVVFAAAVDPVTAADASHYTVTPTLGTSPALAVQSATVADGGLSVLLVTDAQRPGVPYTVHVSGVLGADGAAMTGEGQAQFLGIDLGPNSATSAHDDFNRPSGLATTDLPLPGPWLATDVSSQNTLGIAASPAFEGAGALRSYVADVDPQRDNALVRYKIQSGNEYYLSAYVYVPAQTWSAGQLVSLLRLNEYEYTSHARVAAVYDDATHFGLSVDWRSQLGVWADAQTVASGLQFDHWYWVQLHVRNSTGDAAGDGAVTVWVDGVPDVDLSGVQVAPVKMTYAEFGIGHVVTDGPPALVYTDEARLGTDRQPPALETTPPVTTVKLAHTWWNSTVRATASATDDGVGVQQTSWTLDGAAWSTGSKVVLPLTRVADGLHQLGVSSTDFLGNAETPQTLPVGIDTHGPRTSVQARMAVRRGHTATFRYTVRDPLPSCGSADVRIVLRTARGKVAYIVAAPAQPVNKALTASWVCRLARGAYTYTVTARDVAGNRQVKAGTGSLRVS